MKAEASPPSPAASVPNLRSRTSASPDDESPDPERDWFFCSDPSDDESMVCELVPEWMGTAPSGDHAVWLCSTPKVSELKARLSQETHPRTGRPLLTTASAASLIVFYMFAMQCLSTVAIVRSELKSWRWALGQAAGLTGLAYILAWITHVLLS